MKLVYVSLAVSIICGAVFLLTRSGCDVGGRAWCQREKCWRRLVRLGYNSDVTAPLKRKRRWPSSHPISASWWGGMDFVRWSDGDKFYRWTRGWLRRAILFHPQKSWPNSGTLLLVDQLETSLPHRPLVAQIFPAGSQGRRDRRDHCGVNRSPTSLGLCSNCRPSARSNWRKQKASWLFSNSDP